VNRRIAVNAAIVTGVAIIAIGLGLAAALGAKAYFTTTEHECICACLDGSPQTRIVLHLPLNRNFI
jgi:hypothetical protein